MSVFVRSAFNYDRDQASEASGVVFVNPSMTQQSFKEECDINTIIERFGLAYQVPEGWHMPSYGDFSGVTDFHEACNFIAAAGEQFDLLPADIRVRFMNDPTQLVDFLADDSNREEAIKLGLIEKPVVAPPVVPVAVSPASPVSVPPSPPVAPGSV